MDVERACLTRRDALLAGARLVVLAPLFALIFGLAAVILARFRAWR